MAQPVMNKNILKTTLDRNTCYIKYMFPMSRISQKTYKLYIVLSLKTSWLTRGGYLKRLLI